MRVQAQERFGSGLPEDGKPSPCGLQHMNSSVQTHPMSEGFREVPRSGTIFGVLVALHPKLTTSVGELGTHSVMG